MRALILYSSEGRVPTLAKNLGKELETRDYQVQLMEAEPRGTAPISCASYDLVVVGSPVQGLFGGKIAADMDLSVKRCSRLEGKTSAAFVQPGIFGTAKAMRYLMGLLEHHGAMVRDFASLSTENDVQKFADNLVALADS